MTDLVTMQGRLEALRKARASGIRSVQHGDTRTDYKSDDEMAAAEAALVGLINGESSTSRGPRYIHQSGKGL